MLTKTRYCEKREFESAAMIEYREIYNGRQSEWLHKAVVFAKNSESCISRDREDYGRGSKKAKKLKIEQSRKMLE